MFSIVSVSEIWSSISSNTHHCYLALYEKKSEHTHFTWKLKKLNFFFYRANKNLNNLSDVEKEEKILTITCNIIENLHVCTL